MEHTSPEKKNHLKIPWVQSIIIMGVIFGMLFAFILWDSTDNTVSIENSYLDAPIATIAPTVGGVLNALYVKEGDIVSANSPVALVGSDILYAIDGGIVASTPNVLGSYFQAGETVVSVVDRASMEVVGQVDENKGLKDIVPGEIASFTVDAYPGKTYQGVVDTISPVSEDASVVFSVSDDRPVKKFDIKVRFNTNAYPELKSGMSAKITVHTDA